MPVMDPGREHAPPPAGGAPPAAPAAPAPTAAPPTAEAVFRAIAASDGPWFPAHFAARTGVPREALDEPLTELRLARLVTVGEWVRGVGQGYVLTPEGAALAADPGGAARVTAGPAGVRPPAPGPAADDEPPARPATPRDAAPLVVPLLLVANGLWFAVCASWSIRWGLAPERALREGHPEVLHRLGALTGTDLLAGDWWRLLSACFVHHGALHLLGNLVGLAMLGPLAELLWGRGRLLAIYLVSGLAGSAAAMAVRPEALLAGASGAIWGLHLSLFVWLHAHRDRLPPALAVDWLRRLTVVLLLNVGVSFLPSVSWAGHFGGGAAGFVTACLLLAARDRPARRHRAVAAALLVLVPFACLGGLAAAMGPRGVPEWRQLKQRLADRREWLAARDRAEALHRAEEEFNREVAPRLARLAPDAVRPVEAAAALAANLKAAPERKARDAERLAALQKVADEAASFADRPPAGAERLDRTRAAARAYALARSRVLAEAQALLAAPEPPAGPAWDAWQAARRDADRLWEAVVTK